MWERFWIGFFEYLFIRPITRGTGTYVVVVTEFDATMTMEGDRGIVFSYGSMDTCVPYVYKFNRYADALNFFHKTVKSHIVPTDLITCSYFHKKKGMKKIIEMKW
ncbi:hypothetical protein COPG_00101 [Colwellia phage 9A]|uniref:Uncharacterized protein n=1 Tax=Colwellia phage 9A TaxID=765765 RepID=I3UMI2_9CAUD|nr:hypothetical protein COPG_00101 [Colwellia phage 9A]AFK66697.1 hypothetical protein COPG_00101 [Colwellia phage 9A]